MALPALSSATVSATLFHSVGERASGFAAMSRDQESAVTFGRTGISA